MHLQLPKLLPVVSLLLGVAITVAACGKKQVFKKEGSPSFGQAGKKKGVCLKVVNGILAANIPAVVQLRSKTSGCTGTFLGDNVVLTAAHCMDTSPTGGMGLNDGTMPVAMVHGGFVDVQATKNRSPLKDVALLIFASPKSKVWRKIASNPPKEGDALMVAGYGQTDFVNNNDPDGRVRYGYNAIDALFPENAILFYRSPKTTDNLGRGADSMSGRGDSGGPIISGDGIVAVTSHGGESNDQKLEEFDFYLFSEPGLKAMEDAEAKGAHINGVNGIRKALGRPLKPGAPDSDTSTVDDSTSC